MSKDKELREIIKEVKECQRAYLGILKKHKYKVISLYLADKEDLFRKEKVKIQLDTDYFFENFKDYIVREVESELFPFEASTTKKDIKFLTLLSPEEFEEYCPEAEVID